MSNFDLIYENIKKWHEKIPNVLCISVFVFDDGEARVRIDWHGGLAYTYIATKEMMNQTWTLDAFGDMILSEAERQYRLYEVGEE